VGDETGPLEITLGSIFGAKRRCSAASARTSSRQASSSSWRLMASYTPALRALRSIVIKNSAAQASASCASAHRGCSRICPPQSPWCAPHCSRTLRRISCKSQMRLTLSAGCSLSHIFVRNRSPAAKSRVR